MSVKRGLTTVLIDSRMMPGSGTTLTSGGSIGLQDKTTDGTIELALESIEIYKALRGQKHDGLDRLIYWCGGLVPYWTEKDRTVGASVAEKLQRWDVTVEELSRSEFRSLAPQMSKNLRGAFHCPQEGRVMPTDLTRAIQSSLLRKSPTLFQWRPFSTVQSISADAANYVLTVNGVDGRYKCMATSVVLAVGSYNNAGLWPIDRNIEPRRGLVLTYDALEPMDFVMHGTSYISSRDEIESGPRIAFSFEQRQQMWRIGSSRELIGRSDSNVDTIAGKIRNEAERYIPGLRGKTLRRIDICFRPFEAEKVELVTAGEAPFERVIAINGQEGEGITLAPALARVALDRLEKYA